MSNAALAADRSEARTASDRPEPMNTRHGKKQDRKFGTIIAPYLFVLPAFVIVFVFIVLAALNTFRLAFTDSTLLRPGKFVGFENFIKLFHDEYFLTALLNSTIYVICVVPFMVILPLILAYLVKGNSRIMGFFRTAFYMPVVMSAVVVGMIWTNLLDSAGLVNSVLKALKIISKPIPFLTDRWGVLFSSMFVTIWLGLGYYMVIYLTALANIDESLYEAASLDGAGPCPPVHLRDNARRALHDDAHHDAVHHRRIPSLQRDLRVDQRLRRPRRHGYDDVDAYQARRHRYPGPHWLRERHLHRRARHRRRHAHRAADRTKAR